MASATATARDFEAILYPELACLDPARLRYLLLLYDRLYFLPNDVRLNPGHDTIVSRFSIYDGLLAAGFRTEWECQRATMYASEPGGWDDPMRRLMDEYAQLEDQGLCVALREADFSNASAAHPLEAAVDWDMQDAAFQRICVSALRRKLPDFMDYGPVKGGGVASRPPRWQGHALFSSICSERINTTLYLAARQGFVPVTSDAVFMNLLALKLQRANAELLKGQAVGGGEQRRAFAYGMLSWTIATEVVPADMLARRSIDDVIRYRTASREAEGRFRTNLVRLSFREEEALLRGNAAEVANRLVQTEILPQVEALRAEKAKIWQKLFDEVVTTALRKDVLGALLAAHVLPGVWNWILIGGSVWTAADRIIPKVLEAKRAEEERRRNPMFFVINGP